MIGDVRNYLRNSVAATTPLVTAGIGYLARAKDHLALGDKLQALSGAVRPYVTTAGRQVSEIAVRALPVAVLPHVTTAGRQVARLVRGTVTVVTTPLIRAGAAGLGYVRRKRQRADALSQIAPAVSVVSRQLTELRGQIEAWRAGSPALTLGEAGNNGIAGLQTLLRLIRVADLPQNVQSQIAALRTQCDLVVGQNRPDCLDAALQTAITDLRGQLPARDQTATVHPLAVDFQTVMARFDKQQEIHLEAPAQAAIAKPTPMTFARESNTVVSSSVQALLHVELLMKELPLQLDRMLKSEVSVFGKSGAAGLGQQNYQKLSPEKQAALLAIANIYNPVGARGPFTLAELNEFRNQLRILTADKLPELDGLNEYQQMQINALSTLLELHAVLRGESPVDADSVQHLYTAMRKYDNELPDDINKCYPGDIIRICASCISYSAEDFDLALKDHRPLGAVRAKKHIVIGRPNPDQVAEVAKEGKCVAVVSYSREEETAKARVVKKAGWAGRDRVWFDCENTKSTQISKDPSSFRDTLPADIAIYVS